MGNCMETYTIGEKQQQEEGEEERGGFVKNGLSMKVVLTKEELKWLILELKDKGGVRLEQLLEIEPTPEPVQPFCELIKKEEEEEDEQMRETPIILSEKEINEKEKKEKEKEEENEKNEKEKENEKNEKEKERKQE